MKNLLILITIMLVGGCGKGKEAQTKTKVTEDNNATKPVRKLTEEEKALRESLVGEYEYRFSGTEAKQRLVFQENGEVKLFRNIRKDIECKWSVVDGEIQIHPSQWGQGFRIDIYRINTDDNNATKPITSITQIAGIRGGKREDYGRERTHEKIKSPKEAPSKSVEIANPIVEKAICKELKKPEGELTESDLEKVTVLSLTEKRLTEVPKGLEKLTQLRKLNLRDNQLTDVKGLEKLTQLEWLDLWSNQLTDVKELEKLTQLTWLRLQHNQLTNVKGLEKLTQLTWLRLDSNKLTDVKGLEKLTQLKELYLQHNQLTNVKGLEKLTKLTTVSLARNQLTNVKGLEKLTQLTWLDLRKNQLTDVKGLEKLTQLRLLYLDGNPALTKAQIDELKKALPKCRIYSNPTK